MALIWLFLFLGTWVRLLAIAGFGLHHGAIALALLPLLLVALHQFRPGWLQTSARPALRWPLMMLTALAALAFVRLTLLNYWDPSELPATALLGLAGVGLACLVREEGPADFGPGPWLWVALWMLISARDPALGLVGAGLAPLVFLPGKPGGKPARGGPSRPGKPWVLPLLLGLFLPRPWWDWGLLPGSSLPLAAFGVGGALGCLGAIDGTLRRLPSWSVLLFLALVGLAYGPAWSLAWGTVLGLFTAEAFRRLPRPLPLGTLAAFWILGLVLSFTFQANAWLPGLGHLIWLGN